MTYSSKNAEIDDGLMQTAGGEREVAIAIKRCLESLVQDAKRSHMGDLAEFLALAALAAEDAARAASAPVNSHFGDLRSRKAVGSC
ncbi:hypothetical protein [Niveispirillum irakense]|uniref:hypothetical protein n=1 Tax=Niveispirillum irakense TaxID=34011 RepID=UPI000401BA80|nr:hypothetical protein [Niveispirillum irakense]